MAKIKRSTPKSITVFHGVKHWSRGLTIRARSIEYMIGRGKTLDEAIAHADGQLTYLNDFSHRSILERVMLSAQTSGAFSPFVSTSKNRDVARSFALSEGTSGFILTIQGPQDAFYDFNKIRENCGIPHPTEFQWLEELGIPLQIDAPFKIVKAEQVMKIKEVRKIAYRQRKSRKK